MSKIKLLVIVGPTSSGKSELAVKLAKKMNGEIVSVDSRQIYHGMAIGSGRVPGHWRYKIRSGQNIRRPSPKKVQQFMYKGVPHYGLDLINPRRQYSVAEFQKLAGGIINAIAALGKLPILCGGTAHWVDAVVFDQKFPKAKPNPKLRRRLEKKSAAQLYAMLKKLDPRRARNIDRHNPRRLVRALEIVLTTKRTVPKLNQRSRYDTLWLGISVPQNALNKKIELRLKQRLEQGMFHEVKKLHKQGVSWRRLEKFGLEYKYCALYLQKKLSRDEMFAQLLTAIKQYSKRQMMWWSRNKGIRWVKTG